MKYLLLALLLGMSLISCVEKKADQSKVNTPAKKNAIAAKKNNQKGVKKARRPQAKNNQSLQEALKSNANFSQNDIQKINALNAEFQSKLANSTSANKAGISKLKVERLKKAINRYFFFIFSISSISYSAFFYINILSLYYFN